MSETHPRGSVPVVFWTGLVLVLALVLGVPGAVRNLGAGEPAPEQAVGIPEPIEPEGDLESPPAVFRWTPGGDDVDWAQVVIYRGSYERIWESPPQTEPYFELDVQKAFLGIPAGEPCAWKVREVAGGRARAASRLVHFTFEKDHRGLRVGEGPPEARFLVD